MVRIDEEHAKVEKSLRKIKSAMDEMRDEGLGGSDFESLYLQNRLIPTILGIFREESHG